MGSGRVNIHGASSAHRVLLRIAATMLLVIAGGLLATGCGSSTDPAAAADGPKPRGGQLTIGMDQEPQCLNSNIQCGSMAATSMINGAVFDGMLDIDMDGNYVPLIANEVPTRENGLVKELSNGGMSVELHINKNAKWSDGTPITCEDVRFGWQTRMDERWQIVSRKGWDLMDDVKCPSRLTVVYYFKVRYAPYLGYVSAGPMPKHVLEGKDFNKYFNEHIPIASGPFMIDHWDRAVEVVLKRNDNYWNKGQEDKPYLDTIRYVFVADTNTLKIQLRTGEVDVIAPPPDSTLKDELASFPRGKYEIKPGVYWEHIAFNNAKAPTDDPNVRHAIARLIDRDEITDVVLKGQVKRLDSTLLPAKKEYYKPAWGDVTYDEKVAAEYLEKSGYTRDGQYYTKNGKPLTVQFKTTSGNVLRLKVAQLLQQKLKKGGVKMDIALEPPNVFFGQSTVQGNYHLGLWAWSSGVDPSQITMFTCDSIPSEANEYSGQNNYRYCNEEASALQAESEKTTSVKERAAIVHRIQDLMAADMPLLPLFQRPETLAYTDRSIGLQNNPLGGFGWHSRDWAVAQ